MASIDELISQVLGMVGGGGSGEAGGGGLQQILAPLLEMVQNTPGGLQGLVGKLQESGLADQVSSWVSTGQNAMVDPSKLTSALGPENVQAVAAKAGVPVEQASEAISNVLPQLVDKLSPGGSLPGAEQASELVNKIPGAAGMADQLSGMLGGLLGGKTPPA